MNIKTAAAFYIVHTAHEEKISIESRFKKSVSLFYHLGKDKNWWLFPFSAYCTLYFTKEKYGKMSPEEKEHLYKSIQKQIRPIKKQLDELLSNLKLQA